MLENKTEQENIPLGWLWSFALTVFFAVSLNYDWRNSSLIWYGCLALVFAAFWIAFKGRMVLKELSFIGWLISFILLSVFSLTWALSASVGMDVIKSLIIGLFVLFFIQCSINLGFNVDHMLSGFFVATVINTVYVISIIDLTELGNAQLGATMIEGWNGNGIGFMTAEGVLFGCYLLGKSKRLIEKVFYLAGMIFLTVITLYTGSRTAFVMLVFELILYFCLRYPSKMLRNIIFSILLIIGALYLVMTVESFYNVLGVRMEGLFALFEGTGDVDNSASVRDIFIQNGKKWFSEQPLIGYGINNYKMLNIEATGRFTYAHNNFIELAVDLGVVGLVWYYSAYVYLAVKLIKNLKNSLINAFLLSALLASLIGHYGTVYYYSFYQNFLLLLCFSAVSHTKKERIGDCQS